MLFYTIQATQLNHKIRSFIFLHQFEYYVKVYSHVHGYKDCKINSYVIFVDVVFMCLVM